MRLWSAIDQAPASFFRHLSQVLVNIEGGASRMVPKRLSTPQRGIDAQLRKAHWQLLPFSKIESAHYFPCRGQSGLYVSLPSNLGDGCK